MRVRNRRRIDGVVVALGALVVGGIVAAASAAGDQERITGIWVALEVAEPAPPRVIEVIDYDFGIQSRHGIYRDVPDLAMTAPVVVHSDTAPDDVDLLDWGASTRIRVGDPDRTIRGRHRYRLEYPLPAVRRGDEIAWNAVGTEWSVGISDVEVHIVATSELLDLQCDAGAWNAVGGCAAVAVEPGHVRIDADSLDAGEGITFRARLGAPIPGPALPAAPTGPADDPGTGPWLPFAVAAVAALVAAVPASEVVRRRGRERVYLGGSADAAYGRPRDALGERRVDHAELADFASIEFVPPDDLEPAEGGIVLTERVQPKHQVAWLLDAAQRGEIEITDDDGDTTITDTTEHGATGVLATMLAGRNHLELGTYDKDFAKGWRQLERHLTEWKTASELWDPAGERNRKKALLLGGVSTLVGLGVAAGGGLMANRSGAGWLAVVAVGALLAGAGLTTMVRSWELPVRTPDGSGRWIRIESFRRFIADSEARHVEDAAEHGRLREYTSWAVALDEIDHWGEVAGQARLSDEVASDLRVVTLAPALSRSVGRTAVKPSSSGSGGGGGGVGGGGGGGGGGSW